MMESDKTPSKSMTQEEKEKFWEEDGEFWETCEESKPDPSTMLTVLIHVLYPFEFHGSHATVDATTGTIRCVKASKKKTSSDIEKFISTIKYFMGKLKH